ncbi:putative RNA recognition motif domain, nucleotide-binding alpha-beta plait domain superfamily [Helianthus annuus]|nr:putative RNA recognition motif domain, nucleotide-binding alpha-beta plait domain superfamily [Helianthus annuus]
MERENREEGEIEPEYNDEARKEKAITFYVTNIHPHISDGELWLESKNYGQVVDAYIARKLDKKGKRFGFLRFTNVKDTEKMIKALNQMSFFGWKIKTNVARFVKVVKKDDRAKQAWRKKPENHTGPVLNKQTEHNTSYTKQGLSWADVARGKRPLQEEGEWLTFANESVPYLNWRGKTIVGELKKVEYLKAVGNMKKQMSLRNDQVRYVGGLNVMVIFDSEESLEETLTTHEVLWNRWFSNFRKWSGEHIPFQRIAWLRISGVPLQLWIDGVFNCVGERFGKIIKPSTADEYDINFNYDAVGVLVNHGMTINEKVTIRWKQELFDVWVTEEHRFWTPNLCMESDDGPEPSSPDVSSVSKPDRDQEQVNMETDKQANDRNNSEEVKDSESPVNTVPVPEKEGIPTVGEGTLNDVHEVPEHVGVNEERETRADFGNIEGKKDNQKALTSGNTEGETTQPKPNNNEAVDSRTTHPVGPTGLNEENLGGPAKKTQNKRKRSSIADNRNGSLKPNLTITKKKIPDLNLDLSDESRIRTKKRAISKRDKTYKRRNRARIRIPEAEINQIDQLGSGIEDEYESDWVEELEQEEYVGTSVPETQVTEKKLNSTEVQKEVSETIKLGMELGVDLLQKAAMIEKVVTEDQEEVGQS